MAEENGNRNGTTNGKLVWWMLGIFGALLLVCVNFIIVRFDRLDSRIVTLEIITAQVADNARRLDGMTNSVRVEQLERTTKFGEISTRLALLEATIKAMDDRLNTISQRLMVINNRLDMRGKEREGQENIGPLR
jgi:hypothetical protein